MTTPLPASTGTLLVIGDSISSVYSSVGDQSWTNLIFTGFLYDNREMDIVAVGGWTLSDAYTNRANWINIIRSDIPNDVVIWLGTNDFGAGDTVRPGNYWSIFLLLLIQYLKANSLVRNVFVVTMLPRGTFSGAANSFEARREGKTTTGTTLPGYVNTTTYSSATPDWILVNDGSGNPTLFRCTTGGTASNASPSWSFVDNATTAVGGGCVFTCYGRPYNALIRANAVAQGYTVIDIGADANLGDVNQLTNTTYYLVDKIHPNATQQLNTILPYFQAYIKQGASSQIPYQPTIINSVSPTTGAAGSPFTLTGVNFGELDLTHPLKINGLDCTNVVRVSDIKITGVAPGALTIGGPYDIVYKRLDGQTATLAASFTCAQSVITGVTVGSLPSFSAMTLPAGILNTFSVKIACSLGGAYGATAATLNGVSLTSVSYTADGSTVTGTLPVGSYTASTGNVTVTRPSASPTALTNGITYATTFDPSTIFAATNLRLWLRGDSLVGSGTATGWNDKGTIGNNFTAVSSPPIITASTFFTQNGTGIQTCTSDGVAQQFTIASLNFAATDNQPFFLGIVGRITGQSASNSIFFQYATAGGSVQPLTPNTTFKPQISDGPGTATATSTIGVQNLASLMTFHGDSQASPTAHVSISVNGEIEVSANSSSGLSGIKKSGATKVCGVSAGSGWVAGEWAEFLFLNIEPTTLQKQQYAIYCHNFFNTPI